MSRTLFPLIVLGLVRHRTMLKTVGVLSRFGQSNRVLHGIDGLPGYPVHPVGLGMIPSKFIADELREHDCGVEP